MLKPLKYLECFANLAVTYKNLKVRILNFCVAKLLGVCSVVRSGDYVPWT